MKVQLHSFLTVVLGGDAFQSFNRREKRPGHLGRGRFYFKFLKLKVRKSKRDLERSAEKISPGSDIAMNVVRCQCFKTTVVRSTSQGRNRVVQSLLHLYGSC